MGNFNLTISILIIVLPIWVSHKQNILYNLPMVLLFTRYSGMSKLKNTGQPFWTLEELADKQSFFFSIIYDDLT